MGCTYTGLSCSGMAATSSSSTETMKRGSSQAHQCSATKPGGCAVIDSWHAARLRARYERAAEKVRGAHLLTVFILDADLPFAAVPQLAAQVSKQFA